MSCLTYRRSMSSILYDWFKYILDGGGGQVYQYPKYYFYTNKYYKVLLLYTYFYLSLKENWFTSIHQNWLLIYTHPTVLYTYWMLMTRRRRTRQQTLPKEKIEQIPMTCYWWLALMTLSGDVVELVNAGGAGEYRWRWWTPVKLATSAGDQGLGDSRR